ncbi:hypothetical protein UFOVP797_13 [uncultured Caudovirales phage]|uniref:Uncharacterized protein n=1 Tax=uncultured Caudovirales phage TaxID=2100421 RepID=A0A6J5NVN8_9CAUD|nr:hypothetical protein UFOVP797_13 [uncultured Caudovirales phage]
MSFLENYEDVATRIQRFWATHPSGKIHTSITDIDLVAGYVLVECRVYREFEDVEPSGIDFAYGNVSTFNSGMKKWFVEDTVTSAIGRAVGLVLGTDKRPTAQNMAQVEQPSEPKAVVWDTQEPEDPWATHTATHNTTEPTPRCDHGSRVWKTGEKNGKAWAHYKCQEANRENQCAPIWYVVGSDGKWKPQVQS